MDGLPSKQLMIDVSDPKRRKMTQKTVVIVRAEANLAKHRGEAPPDYWSWRKYGQKPIKDSPYPRAYYRCSSSKGCSAKKQVERCKKDESFIIITYTSNHNHPGPVLSSLNKAINSSHIPFLKEDCCSSETSRNAGDANETSLLKSLEESTEKVQGKVDKWARAKTHSDE
ncbi:probable WRKY transcription factor 65 isoform X2 [Phalaenopsis equestris]|uniref:probable WRKY transcription factor 65 isoform X2 n=1 Tax=Phalaenopsis equestris TaxID=78828 RepID=UPI0009E53FCF|nr:probable WRKY transcription factor 65 isoform X2 [Phalaenopsis equestris]